MAADLRQATAADADTVARFHWAVRRAAFLPSVPAEVLDRKDLPFRLRYWADWFAAPEYGERTFTLLLEEPGRGLVGFTGGGPADREEVPGYAWQMRHLYVAADRRGRGEGRRLFEAGAERLRAAGAERFLLWTPSGNGQARGFYEHLGGRELREIVVEDPAGRVARVSYGWTPA